MAQSQPKTAWPDFIHWLKVLGSIPYQNQGGAMDKKIVVLTSAAGGIGMAFHADFSMTALASLPLTCSRTGCRT